MTTLREAAQQTLEAWDGGDTEWFKRAYTVMEALRAALADPVLQTCNCRWDGEMQMQQCTLHEAHVDAIKEWAQRAKFAEKKLAALAEPCPCGDRPAAQCPGEWEPGCDLGNNPKYAKRVEMTPKELAASIKRGEKWKVAEPGSLMIAAQQFLEWNRAQSPPPVTVGFELGVFEAVKKLYPLPPQRPAEPVLNPAPGYCKHCKQYTIEEPLPAEPVQEPVAWRYKKEGGGWFVSDNEPQYVEQWNDIEEIQPLYAAPPHRKPLSEEEIWALYYALPSDDFERSDRIDFARAVERAHGIT